MTRPVIGTDKPARYDNNLRVATYVGNSAKLKGHRALILDDVQIGYIVAQFNDHATGLGYGWWKFPEEDFKPDKETPA